MTNKNAKRTGMASSVVSYPDRGPWGNSKWRGNASGHLYRELFEQVNRGKKSVTLDLRKAEHLAHFKAPRTVVFGPLPKTSTGKIQKFVLRERAKVLATRDDS